MSDSIIGKKSFEFAIKIINFYKRFSAEKKNLYFPNNFYAPELLWVQMLEKL